MSIVTSSRRESYHNGKLTEYFEVFSDDIRSINMEMKPKMDENEKEEFYIFARERGGIRADIKTCNNLDEAKKTFVPWLDSLNDGKIFEKNLEYFKKEQLKKTKPIKKAIKGKK